MQFPFTINRAAANSPGTGLPFLTQLEYQSRFAEVDAGGSLGYWVCPSNKFPTFQIWYDYDLTSIEIYETSDDVTPFLTLPVTELEKVCNSGTSKNKMYYSRDVDRAFSLPCGMYYFKLLFGVNPALFSEVFVVTSDFCGVSESLFIANQQSTVPGLDIFFQFDISGAYDSYSIAIPPSTYTTNTFTHSLLAAGAPYTIAVTVTIDGGECGQYLQQYELDWRGIGFAATLTKIYPV